MAFAACTSFGKELAGTRPAGARSPGLAQPLSLAIRHSALDLPPLLLVFCVVLLTGAWPGAGLAQDAPLYAFDAPDAVLELSGALDEISGLTVLDEQHLGAVQDEDGKLYVIDPQTGDADDYRFRKGGDYEGIARVAERVFVLRSDGTLYAVTNWAADEPDVETHETPLDASCDAEGLAHDAANDRLLIACKALADGAPRRSRTLYAFDLADERLREEPAYVIGTDAFIQAASGDATLNDRLRRLLAPVVDLSGFTPSALAVHPLTQQLYILSSARPSLTVLELDGRLARVAMLPASLLPQPEGLAFLPNGDLFVASEKAGGAHATLVRFNYRPAP